MSAPIRLATLLAAGLLIGQAHADPELADAAEARDASRFAELLEAKVEIDAKQTDGMTALHWAVYHSDLDAVRALLAAGADPNAETDYRVRPLTLACRAGQGLLTQALLEAGADPNAKLPGGETPLMTAARSGSVEVIEFLLGEGADPNAKQRRGQTALMWAAAAGAGEVIDALLAAGAERDHALKSGFTALHFAARDGQAEAVRRLLAAGADVNLAMHPKNTGGRSPRDGMSALMLAVESGHFELALELVGQGADPNDQRSGYAPLHAISWVRKAGRGDNPEGDPEPRGSGRVPSLEFVRRLVEAGADVNLRLATGEGGRAELDPLGATPFLLAARTADLPLLELLVELGADPLVPNEDGCTPLMAAAGVGVRAVGEEAGTEPEVLEVVAYLFDLGADVNAIDANQETAMHGAAYRNFPRVVAFLSERGADPEKWDHKNQYGWTPMRIAEGYRPGSFKPSPPTQAAIRAARERATPD
ncbi:Phosphocholine transferase AnkX [Planctomycetes bacterium MalM25]|nr:Phosphocholine transferase AnkX [Planctomycetes bacterium MalM25]